MYGQIDVEGSAVAVESMFGMCFGGAIPIASLLLIMDSSFGGHPVRQRTFRVWVVYG